MLDLSVVIITKNEESNLPRCLASLPKGAEVIVVDSGSKDGTQRIAQDFGAKVYTRPFDDHRAQKNAAIAYAERNWILSLDADEQLDPKLQERIKDICSAKEGKGEILGYRLKRQLVFLDRVMGYGRTTDYPIRLFRKGAGHFECAIHERLNIPKKRLHKLKDGSLLHYSYHNLSDYFERFNRYTSKIALTHQAQNRHFVFVAHLLRPWLEFVTRYFLRLGFLDGYAGYTYALMSSLYAYTKYAKLHELNLKAKK